MTWANQVKILKENFKALGAIIGQDFINMLKPAIKALNIMITELIKFAKVVSNSLGVIFGWKYEDTSGGVLADVVDDAIDLGDGLDNASNSAKKLKKQLQGFDELNNLSSNDGGGKGSGVSASPLGDTDAGNWVKADKNLLDYMSDLDTLYKLGDYISTTLGDTLENIDWDNIYSKARDFGKGLASFLNGLINVDTFGSIGKTVANTLNTVIYSALSFGETLDFNNLGLAIANGINKFFENFDFSAFARTLNTFANGLITALTTALKNISWTDVIKGALDFATGLDIGTVAVYFAIKWFFGKDALIKGALANTLKSEIALGIGDAKVPLNLALQLSLITAVVGFKIGNYLYDHFPKVQELADSFAKWLTDGTDKINVGKAITVTLSALTLSIGYAKVMTSLISSLTAIIGSQGVKDAVKGSASLLGNPIFKGFIAGIAFAFAGWNLGQWLYENDVFGTQGIADLIAEKIIDAYDGVVRILPRPVREFLGLEYVKKTNFALSDIKKYGSEAASVFKAGVDKFYDNHQEEIQELYQKIFQPKSYTENKLKDAMSNLSKTSLGQFVLGLSNKEESIQSAYSSVIKPTASTSSAISITNLDLGKKIINDVISGVNSKTTDFINSTKNLINKLPDAIGNISLSDSGSKLINTMLNGVKTGLNGLGSLVNNTINTANKTITPIKVGVETDISDSKINSWKSSILDKWNNNKPTLTPNQTSPFTSEGVKGWANNLLNSWNISKPDLKLSVQVPNFNITYDTKSVAANIWKQIAGVSGEPKINVVWKRYANGGFPEDGWFRASHGEYMGQFDDGTSVIANNNQIIQGINSGVAMGMRNANSEQNMLLREQNSLLKQILDKDTGISSSDVFRAVRRENKSYYEQTGNNALVF